MKKILFLAAAATALFFTASCDKTSSSSSGVVLPAPQHAAQAKKLLLDSSASNPGIDFVEFTESGRYIVRNQILKADESVEFIRGLYTVAGNVYTLNGQLVGMVSDGRIDALQLPTGIYVIRDFDTNKAVKIRR